jgi:CheY-like chemotaxis protein
MMNAYKVLIVEDSYSVGYLMATALSRAGYMVMTAGNGNEALHKISRFNPHCLLLDVVLPDISGFEVCRRLRTIDPQHMCRIVLVSSRNTPLDYRWGWRHGADYYLPKPFSQDMLIQIMSYVVSPEFRIPANPQQLIGAYQPQNPQQPQPPITQEPLDWNNLIPYRKEEPDLMKGSTTFMNVVLVADKRARSVYDAIDNHKSVKQLCYATGLSVKDALYALQSLVEKNLVELYDIDKNLIDSKQFLISQQR